MRRTHEPSPGGAGATEDGWELFAIAAPGLEPWVAAELAALGINGRVEPGGVAFRGGLREIYDANLHLRTASRVVARLGGFSARTFAELERGARRISWARVLSPDRPVSLRVASRKSRLYHTDAIAERIERAVGERLGATPPRNEAARTEEDADDAADDAQMILVRLHRDRVTVSADTSGALLHRRGYREATAKAPLRETLAAAVVLAAGWTSGARNSVPAGPFLDPMCGAGTLAIEAAQMARRIAPGLRRTFAVLGWPGHEEGEWRDRRELARALELPVSPVPILASDRDAGAIDAARANAERAGVAGDLTLERRPLSVIAPPAGFGAGHIVTNPPYGVRIGEAAPLRDLYAQLGNVARARFPGWTLALLASDPRLFGQIRLPLVERLGTVNGGIPVRLMVGSVDGSRAGGR